VDTAVRWNYSKDSVDIGVSHFVGTAREPRFALLTNPPEPTFQPIYDQIRQTSLDINAVSGGWIWKLEALHQSNRIKNYNASIAGFEYTLSNDSMDQPEIGLLTEYAWDSRGRNSPSAFQRDLFFGMRVSLNDVDGSEFLAGLGQDLQHSGRFISLDASRRFGNDARLSVKLRVVDSNSPVDPLSVLSHDDHLLIEYTHHF
jgi:hypothetical protein